MKNIYFADDDPDDREIFAELFYEMFPLAGLRLFENGKALMEALSVKLDLLPGSVFTLLLCLKQRRSTFWPCRLFFNIQACPG